MSTNRAGNSATSGDRGDTTGWLYLVALLAVIYAVNLADRSVIYVLLPSIAEELKLRDWQIGLISGPAFALSYAVIGLPIARVAERVNRARLILAGLSLWSAVTVMSGFATSFLSLVLLRIGLAVGEAGSTPASHSLIGDIVAPEQRATAIGIFTTGATLGAFAGLLLGGTLAEAWGWRVTFMLFGGAGLLLAIVVAATLREPQRARTGDLTDANIGTVARRLFAIPAYRQLAVAAAIATVVTDSYAVWLPSYLDRSLSLSPSQIGLWLGLMQLFGGTLGLVGGGMLADRLARRDERWRYRVPALCLLAGIPASIIAFTSSQTWVVLAALFIPSATTYAFVAPTYSIVHGLVGSRMRAIAIALTLLILSVIGTGIAPVVLGIASDMLKDAFGRESLRIVLLAVTGCQVWAAVHFLLAAGASRHLPKHANEIKTDRHSAFDVDNIG